MAQPSAFRPESLAVITGGASGIGLALATKCASYGMSVIVVGKQYPEKVPWARLFSGTGISVLWVRNRFGRECLLVLHC